MANRSLNLGQLKTMALGAIDETPADNHYGALVTSWINEGLQRMVMEGEGIEGTTTFNTVVGQRDYAMPGPPTIPGEITRIKHIVFDGAFIPETQLVTHDFFSSGTGWVDRFAIWENKILLGPHPPSKVVPVMVAYFRVPAMLSGDTDVPEVPDRFRGYLADYATAQMLLADGRMADAKYYLDSYEAGVRRYHHWAMEKTRSNYKQVLHVMEY